MKTTEHTTLLVGDIIVAAFDEAMRWSDDPRMVARMAVSVVERLLRIHRTRHAGYVANEGAPY